MIHHSKEVILVDTNDNAIGTMEKMEAHYGAHLHRAISVFITDTQGRWLLQQRNPDKYHSKGLWSNACCSHPSPMESTYKAANRRLVEEMGLEAELADMFNFSYKAELENGLTEHEVDHVFWGVTDALPVPDPEEVVAFRYVDFQTLQNEIDTRPELFTEWFKMIYEEVQKHIAAE